MKKLFRKCFIRETRGQAVLETALAGLICIIAFLWIMEWGMCMYCQSILAQAAISGVQYATMHGETAQTNTGHGSGPGTSDSDGSGSVVPYVKAWMAQSALKGSVAQIQVCADWWPSGSSAGGFGNTPCTTGGGTAGDAKPGTFVTVQVYWPYQSYIRLPFTPATLSYTATGTIIY